VNDDCPHPLTRNRLWWRKDRSLFVGQLLAVVLQRINVTFPTSLLEEMRRYVPRRERNRFVVQAAEKELGRIKRRKILEDLRNRPAWTDEGHPDLRTVEDVDRYVRSLRSAWGGRLWEATEGREQGG
jgi:hypothetical protein